MHRMTNDVLNALKQYGSSLTAGYAINICCFYYYSFLLLLTEVAPPSQGYWPYSNTICPNILICTPAFMSSFIRGPAILEEELFRSVRYLVLDEVSQFPHRVVLTNF